MADVYKVSGLLQYEVTVKPYATETVEFIDVRPNYYRVQNFGDTRILCGTSKVPTENNFDFACKANGMFMYSEPTNRGFLYIYNPSGNPARVKVVAFAHKFDPLTLAFSGIELDFSGTSLETSTVISGFNGSLPAGGNKIGSVDVGNFPATLATIAKQNELISKMGDVITAISRQNYVDHISTFAPTNADGDTIISNGGGAHIHLITNDGETNMSVVLGNQSFTLKAGESITDMRFQGAIKLTGSGYSGRAIVSYTY